jgi:hypothetical protein
MPTAKLSFPHEKLTPIAGEPTFTTLQTLQKELFTNAQENQCSYGGRAHGYLGILLSDADYTALATVAFVPPDNPIDLPTFTTRNAPNESIRLEYNAAVEAYETYLLMQSTLKAQIIAAVDHIVIEALEDPRFGFATVTAYQLLTHLITTYSKVSSVDCQNNLVHLAAPWDPSELLLTLWSRVKTCKAVAAAGKVPLRDTQVISIILNVLTNTGVFTTAVDLWQLKDESTWVWTDFVTHVTTHNKLRINKLTAKTAGYHGAHNVTAPPDATCHAVTPATSTATDANNKYAYTMYYCHTHGAGRSAKHTSLTCTKRSEGHNEHATVSNMMGGSTNGVYSRRRNANTTN